MSSLNTTIEDKFDESTNNSPLQCDADIIEINQDINDANVFVKDFDVSDSEDMDVDMNELESNDVGQKVELNDDGLFIGKKVEIFSCSKNQWYTGQINNIYNKKHPNNLQHLFNDFINKTYN